MGTKESSGFKLMVLVGVAAVVAGVLVIRNKMAPSPPPPAPPQATIATAPQPSLSVSATIDAGAPPVADRAALLEAIAAADLAKVQSIHASGTALGGTLAAAAKAGNVPLLTWLIDNGVDVHEDEDSASPPVLEADDNDAVVALLLGRGVKDVTLLQAIQAGAPKAVARLVAGKKVDLNAKTDTGSSLLHSAIMSAGGPKRTQIVKSLLDGGANPLVGTEIETPLHAAIRQVDADSEDAIELVKLLIPKAPVDKDAMMAAMTMHGDKKSSVIDLLLTGKIPPESAFRAISLTSDPKLVPRIVAKGPIAWSTKDIYVEESPLIGAARRLEVDLVQSLLAASAPADVVDEAGESPLLATILSAPPDSDDANKIVNALLAKGANPNRRAKDGRRPLHLAASRGQEAIVKALLAKGAHVDDEVNGTSPLEEAEANGHQEVAKILLAKGAKKKAAPKE